MFSIFAMLIGICMIAFSSATGHMDVFVNILIVLFSFAFIFDVTRSKRYKKYSLPLIIGYLLRISLLYYDVYSSDSFHLPLVGGPLSSDPYYFYQAAIGYSQGISTNYGGFFPRVLGFIFRLTGASRLWAEFWVLLASLGTILVFIHIVEEIDVSQSSRIKGTYLISLLPNYAMMSAILRRETTITFFLSLSLLYFLRWVKGENKLKSIVLATSFALVASLFHGATGLIVAAYIFVMIIYSPKHNKFVLDPKNLVGAIVFMAFILFVYSRYGTVFFGKVESKLEAGVLASTADKGGSSYARYVGDAKTPIRMLIFAIPRFLYFMFSPFPWQWRGASDIITFFMSSFVYLTIILHSIYCIRTLDRENDNRKMIMVVLIITLLTAAVFSWGVTNTGTAVRHRDKFIVMLSLLYVLNSEKRLPIRLKRY